jgi:hypothetical protein
VSIEAQTPIANLADLLLRLGGVGPDRVRFRPRLEGGDALPGFTLQLGQLFAELDRRPTP